MEVALAGSGERLRFEVLENQPAELLVANRSERGIRCTVTLRELAGVRLSLLAVDLDGVTLYAGRTTQPGASASCALGPGAVKPLRIRLIAPRGCEDRVEARIEVSLQPLAAPVAATPDQPAPARGVASS